MKSQHDPGRSTKSRHTEYSLIFPIAELDMLQIGVERRQPRSQQRGDDQDRHQRRAQRQRGQAPTAAVTDGRLALRFVFREILAHRVRGSTK